MVVHLTVGLPVVLEEAAVDEGREALLQGRRGGRAEGGGGGLRLGLRLRQPLPGRGRRQSRLCLPLAEHPMCEVLH